MELLLYHLFVCVSVNMRRMKSDRDASLESVNPIRCTYIHMDGHGRYNYILIVSLLLSCISFLKSAFQPKSTSPSANNLMNTSSSTLAMVETKQMEYKDKLKGT